MQESQSLEGKKAQWGKATVIEEERPNTLTGNVAVDLARLISFEELLRNNCGTGAGGFKKGNSCAKGGGGYSKGDILPDGRKVLKVMPDGGYQVKGPYGTSVTYIDSGLDTPSSPMPKTAPKADVGKSHVDQGKEAFATLEKARGTNFVSLADLRDKLSHLSYDDFAKTVNDMRRSGQYTGSGIEGRYGITEREKAAQVWDSPQARASGERPIGYLSRRV